MSTLLLVRHGESEWNRVGRIQGKMDSPLTERGIAQARAIGQHLIANFADQPYRIYSSPLSRAYQTAVAIVERLGGDPTRIQIDERLNDFDQGEISGTFGWDSVAQTHPELARLRLADPLSYHPPGGESGSEFRARLSDFLTELPADDIPNVIVSHGINNKYLRSIRRNLTGDKIIALGEAQDAIYRLDADEETEISITKSPASQTRATVTVNLGSRSYDILIGAGLAAQSEAVLRPLINGRRVALVTDAVVAQRYVATIAPLLDEITERWGVYEIADGEAAKSFAGLERLLDAMLSDGIDRQCVVIAFGGGVVGDVAGFAAALLMRGIELIQIPTTLMSQVDSAVGGKNAINTQQGKNLVGSFLQPRVVINDVSFLSSLPADELRAGYAEVIKCALLRGEAQFAWLEANVDAIMHCDEAALVEAIRMGCETKASIVSEDERDHGKRALVNLGHTFAHAFEAQAGFGHMPHGAAVAVGLIAACDLSERVGMCPVGLTERVRRHTAKAGLPQTLVELSTETGWNAAAIYRSMLHDKKTVSGDINFVLLTGLGEPVVTADVGAEQVQATLNMLGAA